MGAWGCARHHFWALHNFGAAACWHCCHGVLWLGAVQKENGRLIPQVKPGWKAEVPTPGPGPLKMHWKWQRPSSSQDARAMTDSHQKHTNSFVFIHSTSEQISVMLIVFLKHRSRPWGCSSEQNTSLWWSERGLTIYKWLQNCQMEVLWEQCWENKIIKQDMKIKNGRKKMLIEHLDQLLNSVSSL